MYLTLHADTAGGIVQRNNRLPLVAPAARLPAAVALDGDVAQHRPGSTSPTTNILEFWLFQPDGQPARLGRREAGVRPGHRERGCRGDRARHLDRERRGHPLHRTAVRGPRAASTPSAPTSGSSTPRPTTSASWATDPTRSWRTGAAGQAAALHRVLSSAVRSFLGATSARAAPTATASLDTEDLNGDTGLDLTGTNENVFRYIVDLAADSFFVRNGVTRATGQHRGVETVPDSDSPAERAINTPTLRLVQHLRVTVVTPPDAGAPDSVARLAMARLRFVGSPWVRRSDTPIEGLTGADRRGARRGGHLGDLDRESRRSGVRVAAGRAREHRPAGR